MVKVKYPDRNIIDDVLVRSNGSIRGFSRKVFSIFFKEEFDIDIRSKRYAFKGESDAARLFAFIELEEAHLVTQVLERLYNYTGSDLKQMTPTHDNMYTSIAHECQLEELYELDSQFFGVVEKIKALHTPNIDETLDVFEVDSALEELVQEIKSCIERGKYSMTLDRLHTYCMKYFGYLLKRYGVSLEKEKPLHSRMGLYVKALKNDRELPEITKEILRISIGFFEVFNNIRNEYSLAHDNDLLDPARAELIVANVSCTLKFIRHIEKETNNQPDSTGVYEGAISRYTA